MADGTIIVPMKVCTRCGVEKPATADYFHRCDAGKYLARACKACRAAYDKRRQDPLGLRKRSYRPRAIKAPDGLKSCGACGEQKAATAKFFTKDGQWLRSLCKNCESVRRKELRLARPPKYDSKKTRIYNRRWREKDPAKARALHRRYAARRRERVQYRVHQTISVGIRQSIAGKSGRSWEKLVSFTLQELIIHLERQFSGRMSWANYGTHWHIDHIRPISSFRISSVNDPAFQDCWSLPNLRPLRKIENLSKRDRRTHLI